MQRKPTPPLKNKSKKLTKWAPPSNNNKTYRNYGHTSYTGRMINRSLSFFKNNKKKFRNIFIAINIVMFFIGLILLLIGLLMKLEEVPRILLPVFGGVLITFSFFPWMWYGILCFQCKVCLEENNGSDGVSY